MAFEYEKVNGSDKEDDLEKSHENSQIVRRRGLLSILRSWSTVLLAICLIISLFFNLWWIPIQWSFPGFSQWSACNIPELQKSPYSGLSYDVPTQYFQQTEYNGENETHADYMWENLSLDAMVIAPTTEWAQEMGLTHSWEFPWDPSKRQIYFLKVYHQIHCLRVIRRSFRKLGSGEGNYTALSHHVEHCLDTLRQDIMCKADDTPMPSLLPVNGAGEGQVMKCKNLDKLFAWAKHPDRDACYRRLSEFDPPSNSIERYAFCEPDSQYYPTMSQFFEGYGKSVGGSDG